MKSLQLVASMEQTFKSQLEGAPFLLPFGRYQFGIQSLCYSIGQKGARGRPAVDNGSVKLQNGVIIDYDR